MEELVIPNIKKVYIECAREAIECLQKIDLICHKLRRATRRQKDLMNRDLEQLYSKIRQLVEYVLKIRRVQPQAIVDEFDKFIADKAKPLTSDEPEVYFAKQIAAAIAERAEFNNSKRKR